MTQETNTPDPAAKILIVEDDHKTAMVLEYTLSEYEVFVASNGPTALETIDKITPDLILMDVMLPGINGFEICHKLKQDDATKDIPVIFLTGMSRIDDIVKGFNIGAVDYLIKPFNRGELLARVSTQLDLLKAKRELLEMERKLAVTAMAVTANHEINQPLTVLKGHFDILQQLMDQDPPSEKKQQCIEKMDESISKITAILKQFMKAGKESIDFQDYLEHQKMVVFKEIE